MGTHPTEPIITKFGVRGLVGNHWWQILSRSVKGFSVCGGPKMGVSYWLELSPLQQVSTTVLPVMIMVKVSIIWIKDPAKNDKCLANVKRSCNCSVLCLRPKSSLWCCPHPVLDMTSFGSAERCCDSVLKVKLHLFDLLWICCTTSCTTYPQHIHDKSTTNRKLYNKSTTSRHVEMYNELKVASKSTTNLQQIEAIEFSYDLL